METASTTTSGGSDHRHWLLLHTQPVNHLSTTCQPPINHCTVVDFIFRVVQLPAGSDAVMSINYAQPVSGPSKLSIEVETMCFYLNKPFIRKILSFVQDSFSTWQEVKPKETPASLIGPSRRERKKHRPVNQAIRRKSYDGCELLGL